MTSQVMEEAWIRTGGYGRLGDERVNMENNNFEVNTIHCLVPLSNKRRPQISAALEA